MKKHFLLIQGGEVVDSATKPERLAFSFIDETVNFNVAIGCINEFGKQEVVGIVAGAYPTTDSACHCWRVTSFIDGADRLIGATGRISSFLRSRLMTYNNKGKFDDLANLPAPITIVGAL